MPKQTVPSPFPSADYDQQRMRADQALRAAKTLQDLADAGWPLYHLKTKHGFDRYTICGDASFWTCPDCASIDADCDEGCDACGYGTAEYLKANFEECAA